MCVPAVAITGTDKVSALMIGPYSTPSTLRIMPSIVAPGTEGLELAVTENPEIAAAPLDGELMVMMSSVACIPLARAAGMLHRLTTLRIMHKKIILVDITERDAARY